MHAATSTQVNIGLRVLTRPDPGRLPDLYRELGTDYAERVLPSIIQVGTCVTSQAWAASQTHTAKNCCLCLSSIPHTGNAQERCCSVQRQPAPDDA